MWLTSARRLNSRVAGQMSNQTSRSQACQHDETVHHMSWSGPLLCFCVQDPSPISGPALAPTLLLSCLSPVLTNLPSIGRFASNVRGRRVRRHPGMDAVYDRRVVADADRLECTRQAGALLETLRPAFKRAGLRPVVNRLGEGFREKRSLKLQGWPELQCRRCRIGISRWYVRLERTSDAGY